MKNLLIIAVIGLLSFDSTAQDWSLDKAHGKLGFGITHLLISDVEGNFKNFDVKVMSKKADFSDAQVEMTAQINSINTDNQGRDEHLQSADYFDAVKYPTMTFKSTSMKLVKGKQYALKGNLTLRGVTKPVTLNAVFNGTGVHPYSKKTVAGFKITGTIKRSDFGVGAGTPSAVLGEEVDLNANIELEKN